MAYYNTKSTGGQHKLPQATDRHMGPMSKTTGQCKSKYAAGNGITSKNCVKVGVTQKSGS